MALDTYRRMRHFERTPEPRGARTRRGQYSFVIQKHHASHLHYDFRLELDGVLKSWAVPKGPSLDPSQKRLAIEVEDHPLEYGGFEGTIPKGEYGAGTVIVWDRGRWDPEDDPHQGLRRGRLAFALEGEKLHGAWRLVRLHGRDDDKKPQWLLMKADDRWARRGEAADITATQPDSVLRRASGAKPRVWHSNRKATRRSRAPSVMPRARRAPSLDASTIAGARPAAQPRWIKPELATLVDAAPAGEDWLHEIKYDGYRMECLLREGKAKLLTRSGQDWTASFASVAEAVAALPVRAALLDGEVVALQPDGRSSFQSLQNAMRRRHDEELVYFVFDLLHFDGVDLTHAPLEQRKQLLADLLGSAATGVVRYSDHVAGNGPAFHREACARGLEGIVSKRRDAPYRPGRAREWLKIKCGKRQEFVIGGFTDPQGSRHAFGALLVGAHDATGALRYCGKVGTGFNSETLSQLHRRLAKLEAESSPFANAPRGRGVHWVKPELVAEIAFTEMTRDGQLRHPSFQGLREDKPASEVMLERAEHRSGSGANPARASAGALATSRSAPRRGSRGGAVEIAGVTLTSPGKVLYPENGITKLDLARYLETVAPRMLPEIGGRPLMLKRCPEGRLGTCFFQKHPGRDKLALVGLDEVPLREKQGPAVYLAVRDASGLVSLAQVGALEIHVWGSRAATLEKPDRLVFDLDPGPEVEWKLVIETARAMRSRLDDLGLESFVKTTGGKGLHVVIPIRPGPAWDDIATFTSAVAASLVREAPDRLTTRMAKAGRERRILIDTLRNRRGATWVAPYSARAREGATVSMPLEWDEVTTRLDPRRFDVKTAVARLRKPDPWSAMRTLHQSLTAAAIRKIARRGE